MEAIINSQLLYPSLGLASLILVLRAILVVSGVPKPVNFHAWDPFRRKANQEFEADASGLIAKGLKKDGSSFRLATKMGTYLVLADRYAEEIRNDERFSAYDALVDVILLELPGFETSFQGSLHNHVSPIAVQALNKELLHLTQPLSDEASNFLRTRWSDVPDWQIVDIRETVLGLVAQMTTRALIGPELSCHAEWLDIAISFTTNRAIAVAAIQGWPRLLQPMVHWFLSPCRAVRKQIRRAKGILLPVLRQKMGQNEVDPSSSSSPTSIKQDFSTLTFIDRYAQGKRYDATLAQLRLIAVSVLTTADLVEKVVARLLEYPELIEPLREEVIAVLTMTHQGMHRNSLMKLTLMESVMRESQRLEPATLISMFRVAKKTVILQDGTVVPRGTNLAFANDSRLDPTMYPNPERFDGYRFQRMREDPSTAGLAPFTRTRMSHLAFGHGKHACPGRFLSCDEAKLILCHILLKYDIRAPESGNDAGISVYGMFVQRKPGEKMEVKMRQMEPGVAEILR
ncbi:Cytochrome monooxygenase roqO [Penicillium oxalicum]|uniref:Cytochrome monooxygenase roqO n=1 Tax=Penicillium oxalicum TaxID=69781 RepID=UPI0020B82D69|nr:Cytochrome monooxygenase roqO [Penicillium oxalicum]KAI2791646.1 Cytochrome monooxygenase roqO [Penicillium oxalicum]